MSLGEFMFLNHDEIAMLTGRKIKRLQIQQLLKMNIPHFVNACGFPVVPKSVIEGSKQQAQNETTWIPAPLRHGS